MSTHNICFHEEKRKIFTRYPLLSRPVIHWVHMSEDAVSDAAAHFVILEIEV